MKNLLFLCLLISSTAWACDSYEDCMKGVYKSTSDGHPYAEQGSEEALYLKAIAYKLADIEKKLDVKESD